MSGVFAVAWALLFVNPILFVQGDPAGCRDRRLDAGMGIESQTYCTGRVSKAAQLKTADVIRERTRKRYYVASIVCHLHSNLDTIILVPCVHSKENTGVFSEFIYRLGKYTTWKLPFNDSMILIKEVNNIQPLKLRIPFVLTDINHNVSVSYVIYDRLYTIITFGNAVQERVGTSATKSTMSDVREKRGTAGSGYLVVANRLYLHEISQDGSRSNVVVGGLKYALAVDFHFRKNFLFWIDSGRQAIMRSTLDGQKKSVILDHGLTEPESLSVDWISDKIYWTDKRERRIGVLDLRCKHNYKYNLLRTDNNSPQGIVVDPTTRTLYWTEWGIQTTSRICKASTDGTGKEILHDSDLLQPYGLTIDFESQTIFWADLDLQRVDTCNTDGTNRRIVVNSGVNRPYALSLHGDTLYISDWNFGVLATNKSGGQPVSTVSNTFCTYLSTFDVQVVAEDRQLLATNPCKNNGGCSHLCLLSSNATSSSYTCVCPNGMFLGVDGTTCSQLVNTTSAIPVTVEGSCSVAGYTTCCAVGLCFGSPATCFCDSDCYLFGDCCNDIQDVCSNAHNNSTKAFILLANTLYIHLISVDGKRNKTIHTSSNNIIAVDYDYRSNVIYWSTSNGNGLWRSQFDGSGAINLLSENIHTVDDIAVDWISSKLYWTESGLQNKIKVLDLEFGHTASVVNFGQNVNPRAIVVDPVNKWMYWSVLESNNARIEKASMDGENHTIVHDSELQQPYGLTIDYDQQVLYWIDAGRNRIERSGVDGSNRRVVISQGIFYPFGLTTFGGILYYTDEGIYTVSNNGGIAATLFDSICATTAGLEIVGAERQPTGTNLCQADNGGCSHLCLLSVTHGASCACPDGFRLGYDRLNCESNSITPTQLVTPVLTHGTCAAAGYTGGCCTSGSCRGMPPTCSCDSTCVVFQDCCVDVPPSCQPEIDVLEFIDLTVNVTLVLAQAHPVIRQLHCSVRASRVTNFEWTFLGTNLIDSSGIDQLPQPRQITNEAGALDAKFSVVSTDYSSVLTIEDVEFSDAGNYTCIASIGDRINPILGTTIFTVYVFPSLLNIEGSDHYSEGQTLHLRCKVKVFPPPAIIWIVEGSSKSRILRTTSRVSVSTTHFIENVEPYSMSNLYINNVISEDSNTYMCIVSADSHDVIQITVRNVTIIPINECEQTPPPCLNGATCVDFNIGYECLCTGEHTKRDCSQRINTSVPLAEPSFIIVEPNRVTPNFGAPANLTCLARGHPSPSYQWFKDGVVMTGETRPYLYIPDTLPDDRGDYTCQAINSEGSITSTPVHLSIEGVLQYFAILKNQSTELSDEAMNRLYFMANIYSIEQLRINTTSETHLLVTIVQTAQVQTIYEIRQKLSLALESIGLVYSLTRFDGCELGDQTEFNIGEIMKLPCPCYEFLSNLLDGQQASRHCDGSYSDGGDLQNTDFSQCVTVTDDLTNSLCSAALNVQDSPVESTQAVFNITANYMLKSNIDVTLLSTIIEKLTDEATTNQLVVDNYLKIIDNFQNIEPTSLITAQDIANSSSRVLESLEKFAAGIRISPRSSQTFTHQSFGVIVTDVNSSEFQEQTFSVFNTRASGADSGTVDITAPHEWMISVTDGPVLQNGSLAAMLQLTKESLSECLFTSSSQVRLSYFSFFKSSLFLLAVGKLQISPIIVAARLNYCSIGKLFTPINIKFLVHDAILFDWEHSDSEQANCASWFKGQWSTNECHSRRSSHLGEDRVTCECHQLSHFGILWEQKGLNLHVQVYTYLAVSISSIFLVLATFTYVTVRQLRSSFLGITLINTVLATFLSYTFYIIGSYMTTLPALCIVSSALLQMSILVIFVWTVALYLHFYINLECTSIACQFSKKKNSLIILALWIMPLLFVGTEAGIWHKYYYTTYYCGVVEQPLWFGILLPLSIMFIITTVFIILTLFTFRKKSHCSQNKMKLIAISIITTFVFYVSWSIGMLSINLHLNKHASHLQIAFAISVSIQGILVFLCSVFANDNTKRFWIRRVFQSFESKHVNFCTKGKESSNSRGRGKEKTVIPTETNEAYESVLLYKHKIKVSPNDAYGHISTLV